MLMETLTGLNPMDKPGAKKPLLVLTLLTTLLALCGCQSFERYARPYGDECVQHGGRYRCWDVHVPDNLEDRVPLMIDLHGWKGTPARQRGASGFESLASSEGFIIVWPYGIDGKWNTESEPASQQGILDDVGFLRALVTSVSQNHDIDQDRIYLTGHSMGCAMAQRFANEASDTVAAVACMSHYLLVAGSADYSPVSVMQIHGMIDDTVVYKHGPNTIGATQNFDTWRSMNNCTGDAVESWISDQGKLLTYTECGNGTEVAHLRLERVGHYTYKWLEKDIDTTRMAWDFMKRFANQGG